MQTPAAVPTTVGGSLVHALCWGARGAKGATPRVRHPPRNSGGRALSICAFYPANASRGADKDGGQLGACFVLEAVVGAKPNTAKVRHPPRNSGGSILYICVFYPPNISRDACIMARLPKAHLVLKAYVANIDTPCLPLAFPKLRLLLGT